MLGRRVARIGALGLGLAACRPPVPDASAPPKLSPELLRELERAPGDAKLRVLVDLAAQLDLATLGDTLAHRHLGHAERRRLVVAALAAVAQPTQAALAPLLERLRRDGAVESYQTFTVVNRLLVVGTPRAIRALGARDEVAGISEETAPQASVLAALGAIPSGGPRQRSWAVGRIGAARLWRRGLDGRGVVVGIIDAGASAAHEQLRGTYRGGARSWYDPSARDSVPLDGATGHGTAVLSAAVAQNVAGKVVGIAPGARWVACVGLPEGRYDNVAFTQCADWMLMTAQPDVLINAWTLPLRGCDRSLERIVAAWRVAGILPVFAAGNRGPEHSSDASPANYGLSVGGVTRSGAIVTSSSRGPNSCDGAVFPTLVAPAESVPAAFPLTPSAYIAGRGTSIAAGLVAGAAALLVQRYPAASVPELEQALRQGARRPGPGGADNTYGYGVLDVAAALDSLASLLVSQDAPRRARTLPTHR